MRETDFFHFITTWVPDTSSNRGRVRAHQIRRRARSNAHRAESAVAEVAVDVSFAGQSPSSTRNPSRRIASPCVWYVYASAECRSCCRWLDNMGTVSVVRYVCGSDANDWSPAFRRPGISIMLDCQATRRTSRDKRDLPARSASNLQTQQQHLHAFCALSIRV